MYSTFKKFLHFFPRTVRLRESIVEYVAGGGFGLTLYILVPPVSAVPVCALGYLLVIIQVVASNFCPS